MRILKLHLSPADSSTTVSLRIFAAFEFERMLGRGQLMRKAELTVGELLHHSDQSLRKLAASLFVNAFHPNEITLAIFFFPDGAESSSLLVKVDRGLEGEPDAAQFGQRYSVSVVDFTSISAIRLTSQLAQT